MIKVKKRKILLLPGDGIGPEVIQEVLHDIEMLLAKKEKITTLEANLKNSKPWIFNDKN